MNKDENFKNTSYVRHSEFYEGYGRQGEKEDLAKTWLDGKTTDAWRHGRFYRSIDPILSCSPNSTWLTVGDGRYGKDAKYILDKGGHALASDISDILLKEAKEMEKVALGVNYRFVAFKGINDFYVEGVEREEQSARAPLMKKIKRRLSILNILCKLKVSDFGLLAVLILKDEPSEDLVRHLAEDGYEVVRLPANPYLS